MNPHDEARADSTASGLGFTGLTAFGPRPEPLADEQRLPAGTSLDDVTIVRFVAQGGMGCVYEGRQGVPSRTVAVKVLRPGVLSSTAAKRFLHEAHVLGRLGHPGIARIYSVGVHRAAGGPLPYFVMEFLEAAASITDHAAAAALSFRDRVRLFREVCAAVAHGHQKGVIHRDLKPSNILVDAHGQPKVIDFGVARSTDGDVALTTMHTDVGQMIGTLRYMSPEQFIGNVDDLDVRADVYALGVVLYELLAGRPPYDLAGKAVHQVAAIVQHEEPKRLGLVDRRLRGDLETMVATCLEKDRSRRYSSAAELEADLGRWLAGEPIAAARPGLVDSLARLARRHRLAAAATVAVATAVIAGTAGVAMFAMQADRARREATALAAEAAAGREAARQQRDRADAEASMAKRLLVAANIRSIQTAVGDGSRQAARQLLAETAAMVSDAERLEFRCLAAELDDAEQVITAEGPVASVAFSPDGRVLAAASTTGLLQITPRRPSSEETAGTASHGDAVSRLSQVEELQQLLRARLCEKVAFHDASGGGPLASLPHSGWAAAFRANANLPPGDADASARPLTTSSDAARTLVYDDAGTPTVVEASSGRQPAALEGARGRLLNPRFSGDGRHLAACNVRGALSMWNATDGRLVASIGDERDRVANFEFSGDATRLVVAVSLPNETDVVVVHDVTDGGRLSTLALPAEYRATQMVMAVNSDGSRLATGDRQGNLDLWATATGNRLGGLADDRTAIESLAFSSDDRRLASGWASGRVAVWDASTLAPIRECIGHDGMVLALAFDPDGVRLASGSIDGTVRLWRLDGPPRLSVIHAAAAVTEAVFSPAGDSVAVAIKGTPRVEVWDVATVERAAVLEGTAGVVEDLAWSPDGRSLAAAFAVAGRDGEARLWRLESAGTPTVFPGHAQGAIGVTFTPDGTRLVTSSRDGLAMAWDLATGRRLWVAPVAHRTPGDRLRAAVVRQGRSVAHGPPHLLDVATGGIEVPFREPGRTFCMATDATGSLLAMGAALGTTYLIATDDGATRGRLFGHRDAVSAVAFAADGRRLATGSLDGTARLWLTDGNTIEQACLSGHGGAVETVAFSPDGSRLLTGASDGYVRLWDSQLGRLLCVMPAPHGAARAAAISPDGRLVLAGTEAGELRLWGLTNAEIAAARRRSAGGSVVGRPGNISLPGGLFERREERGEVGQVLAIEPEGPEVR